MDMKQILSTLALAIASASTMPAQAKLEVHEWGTFTSLIGSNGVTQDGMYHEDEPLPPFVHGFGETIRDLDEPPPGWSVAATPRPNPTPIPPPPPPRCPRHSKACFGQDVLSNNVITQKMETPVLYFYSDKEQRVEVNVKFPQGVVTETFPGPVQTSPTYTYPTRSGVLNLANGNTTFKVDVLTSKTGNLPTVRPDNIYSHARNVASNVVQAGRETEKFIFYRGLGRFQPEMKITSAQGGLSINSDRKSLPQAAFLLDVDANGRGKILDLGNFVPGKTKVVSAQEIASLRFHGLFTPPDFSSDAYALMLPALLRAGLNADEARAMLDTWKNGYFKVPGLRLLYILPRTEVDANLPLTVSPTPDRLERVFVGRMEILLDTDERRILSDIKREQEAFDVASLGRFAEPMLRRVQQVYAETTPPAATDSKIVFLLSRLINQAAFRSPTSADVGSVSTH